MNKLKIQLQHIVTTYDIKQSKKRYYNVYALAQYLKRCDEVLLDVEQGASINEAIAYAFSGALLGYVIKELAKLGYDMTNSIKLADENTYLTYKPASSR